MRASEGIVSWETAELFTGPRHWISEHGHCISISAVELMQRTNSKFKKRPQSLSVARIEKFKGVFEHSATASRMKFEVGQASLVVSSEPSTAASNDFETADVKEKF